MKELKSTTDAIRDIAGRFYRHENALLGVVLIAIVIGMSVLTRGLTTSAPNVRNILIQSSVLGIASVGQTFVILTAGIDVAVGGIGLFSSLLGTLFLTESYRNIVGGSIPMYLAISIILLMASTWGALSGFLVSRIRVPPLIVTLGMWQITTGAAFQLSGGIAIANLPQALAFFGRGHLVGVPIPVVVFIAVVAVAYFILYHTTFGRSVYAAGGNPVSAWLCGINVKNIQFMVYVISGFLAGLGGLIMTARVMSASMQTLLGLEMNSIAATCVGGISLMGGRGSLIGVVIGVLIIGVINNAMSVIGAGPAFQGMLRGAIIITAVAVDYTRRRG